MADIMSRHRRLAVTAFAFGSLLGAVFCAAPARAQRSDFTARAELNSNLHMGIAYAEQAMNIVQSSTDLEDIRRARKLALDGYLAWNRARGHLTAIQLRAKFPDPMLDYTLKTIDLARQALAQAESRTGHIVVFESGRAENTAAALDYYAQALRHARRAAEFANL